MQTTAEKTDNLNGPEIIHRTRGNKHGVITRLVSPGDLGELIKPFIFLDRFDSDNSQRNVFPYHPHSGIVTVTTLFEGTVEYEDSTGKAGVLTAGTVEWMQAGNGVWHTAKAVENQGGNIRGYQLWLALPSALENSEPESIYVESADIPKAGAARVIIGEYQGVKSPLPQVSPMTYLHVRLEDGEKWTFDPPVDHDVLWLAIDEGSIRVSGETLSNEIVIFDSKSIPLILQAEGVTNFVLGSAMKHPHPLVIGYYSVHTTKEALLKGEQGIQEVGNRLKIGGRIYAKLIMS